MCFFPPSNRGNFHSYVLTFFEMFLKGVHLNHLWLMGKDVDGRKKSIVPYSLPPYSVVRCQGCDLWWSQGLCQGRCCSKNSTSANLLPHIPGVVLPSSFSTCKRLKQEIQTGFPTFMLFKDSLLWESLSCLFKALLSAHRSVGVKTHLNRSEALIHYFNLKNI